MSITEKGQFAQEFTVDNPHFCLALEAKITIKYILYVREAILSSVQLKKVFMDSALCSSLCGALARSESLKKIIIKVTTDCFQYLDPLLKRKDLKLVFVYDTYYLPAIKKLSKNLQKFYPGDGFHFSHHFNEESLKLWKKAKVGTLKGLLLSYQLGYGEKLLKIIIEKQVKELTFGDTKNLNLMAKMLSHVTKASIQRFYGTSEGEWASFVRQLYINTSLKYFSAVCGEKMSLEDLIAKNKTIEKLKLHGGLKVNLDGLKENTTLKELVYTLELTNLPELSACLQPNYSLQRLTLHRWKLLETKEQDREVIGFFATNQLSSLTIVLDFLYPNALEPLFNQIVAGLERNKYLKSLTILDHHLKDVPLPIEIQKILQRNNATTSPY